MSITEKDKEVMMNLVTGESFFVVGSAATKHPYVEWNKEDGEDQIYVCKTEESFRKKDKEFRDKKYPTLGIKVEQKDMKQFFVDLYSFGVSQVVIISDEEEYAVKMENVIPKPNFSHLPENQQPLLNPSLEISLIYFLQELSRQIPLEEKTNFKELEEEMIVNVANGSYLLPIRMTIEVGDDWNGKLEDGTFDIPYLTNKAGEYYLPIFADVVEFNKFNIKNELKATIIPFAQAQKMMNERVQGVIINPASMSFRLLPKTVDTMVKRVQ